MKILRFFCILLSFFSCSEKNKDVGKTAEVTTSSLLSFALLYENVYYDAVEIEEGCWHVSLPTSAVEKSLYAKCELEEGVIITPSPNLLLDYSNPVVFTLSDADGNNVKIKVTCSNDLPYYGVWMEAGDEIFYPTLGEDGERLIIVPKGVQPKLNYRIPDGGSIEPLPDLVQWSEDEVMKFTITNADGTKMTHSYRWVVNDYFVMVVLGDPEYDMRNCSLEGGEIKNNVDKILSLQGKTELYFEPYVGLRIGYRPSLVLVAGDINTDNSTDEGEEFMQVFGAFYENGIPCIAIAGNHDWQPYHWGDLSDYKDKNDYGYTRKGSSNNDKTLKMVDRSIVESEKLGITDVHRFLSSDYGHNYREVSPFVFKYKGIRFYCGQCYWFQQWYKEGGLFPNKPATFYCTDEIIDDLEKKIETDWGQEPAVWMQHYPLSNQKEWWHDRQGFEIDGNANQSRWRTYEDKLAVMKRLICKTNNPVFFAGHTHKTAHYVHENGNIKFDEWVTGYFQSSYIYVVLMKENYGVVEVKEIQL